MRLQLCGWRNTSMTTSWQKASFILALLFAGLMYATPAHAQTPTPVVPSCAPPYECVQEWTFDADYEGWTTVIGNHPYWLSNFSLSELFNTTTASGVIRMDGSGWVIRNSTYLQPGWYGVVVRSGSDDAWFDPGVEVRMGNSYNSFLANDIFQTSWVTWFEVTSPGPVVISLTEYGNINSDNRRVFIDCSELYHFLF